MEQTLLGPVSTPGLGFNDDEEAMSLLLPKGSEANENNDYCAPPNTCGMYRGLTEEMLYLLDGRKRQA